MGSTHSPVLVDAALVVAGDSFRTCGLENRDDRDLPLLTADGIIDDGRVYGDVSILFTHVRDIRSSVESNNTHSQPRIAVLATLRVDRVKVMLVRNWGWGGVES